MEKILNKILIKFLKNKVFFLYYFFSIRVRLNLLIEFEYNLIYLLNIKIFQFLFQKLHKYLYYIFLFIFFYGQLFAFYYIFLLIVKLLFFFLKILCILVYSFKPLLLMIKSWTFIKDLTFCLIYILISWFIIFLIFKLITLGWVLFYYIPTNLFNLVTTDDCCRCHRYYHRITETYDSLTIKQWVKVSDNIYKHCKCKRELNYFKFFFTFNEMFQSQHLCLFCTILFLPITYPLFVVIVGVLCMLVGFLCLVVLGFKTLKFLKFCILGLKNVYKKIF